VKRTNSEIFFGPYTVFLSPLLFAVWWYEQFYRNSGREKQNELRALYKFPPG